MEDSQLMEIWFLYDSSKLFNWHLADVLKKKFENKVHVEIENVIVWASKAAHLRPPLLLMFGNTMIQAKHDTENNENLLSQVPGGHPGRMRLAQSAGHLAQRCVGGGGQDFRDV